MTSAARHCTQAANACGDTDHIITDGVSLHLNCVVHIQFLQTCRNVLRPGGRLCDCSCSVHCQLCWHQAITSVCAVARALLRRAFRGCIVGRSGSALPCGMYSIMSSLHPSAMHTGNAWFQIVCLTTMKLYDALAAIPMVMVLSFAECNAHPISDRSQSTV